MRQALPPGETAGPDLPGIRVAARLPEIRTTTENLEGARHLAPLSERHQQA